MVVGEGAVVGGGAVVGEGAVVKGSKKDVRCV